MLKKVIAFFVFYSIVGANPVFAQEQSGVLIDSAQVETLDEVLIISTEKGLNPLLNSTDLLEKNLEDNSELTAIKRGAYAWEINLNNMSSERVATSIDGMQIFMACTDKMDPVTSYVSSSNLSFLDVESGYLSNQYNSNTAGQVYLGLKKGSFQKDNSVNTGINTAYGANNKALMYGAFNNYNSENYYHYISFERRNASNYSAGDGQEILYSQYTKNNLYTSFGYKLDTLNHIEASLIYDLATDVGYPALPMDVSKAEGIIAQTSWFHSFKQGMIKQMELKVYANKITHIMDDSQREDVPIRMDMPGWSNTVGGYIKLNAQTKKHKLTANFSSFYNQSLAEMTMYPNNPDEIEMFMYTWPDVRTFQSGLFLADRIEFDENFSFDLSLRMALQQNRVADEVGYESLAIFYPGFDSSISRGLYNFSTAINWDAYPFKAGFGIDYGNRAPSVSEAYAFYIFNANDNFDYIGNPELKTEKSLGLNMDFSWKLGQHAFKIDGYYAYMPNYIVGIIDEDIDPMTIGAQGVKTYQNLDFAQNLNMNFQWTSPHVFYSHLSANLNYAWAQDSLGNPLAFIPPPNAGLGLHVSVNDWNFNWVQTYFTDQNRYSSFYGEQFTPSYTTSDLDLSKQLFISSKIQTSIKLGVENLFDKTFSSYSSWNNVLEMGRNLYMTLSFKF